jgi:PhnB protein
MSSETVEKTYQTVTPYLVVKDVARLIKFLVEAFDARERIRLPRADGSVMHAEVVIGDSIVMMGEPTGDIGLMPASIYLRVDDADASYARAIAAGGTSVAEPKDQPHAGERYGGVKDLCGNIWWPAMAIELG